MLTYIGNVDYSFLIMFGLIVIIAILPIWLIVEIIRYLRRH